MSRYYSDSDNEYYASRQQQSNTIRASGWQSPIPRINETTGSSSISRLVVECPFGRKKCDYTIDKSQPGRLIITARRRQTFSSNNIAVQTFTIPYDADVNHLKSYIEKNTNRLIIEIPRVSNIYKSTSKGNISRSIYNNNQRKNLEYRIDCRDYKPDELDVFIEGRDVIIQGKTKRTKSSDPTQRQVSKQFTRKIALANTVDLSKVRSYFENGELRIQAPPLKHGIYDRQEIVSSPLTGNHRRQYRRREHVSRIQPSSSTQRVRSADGLRYREFDDDDGDDYDDDDSEENRYRRTANYVRDTTNQNDIKSRSIYTPSNRIVTRKTTTYRDYPVENHTYYKY